MNAIMTWEELTDYAYFFPKIVVTGNQRSGTTYAAYALATELNYTHVDEMRFKAHNFDLFKQLLKDTTVVQAPALLHRLPELNLSNTLVVFMTRDSTDIIKSMNKSGWLSRESAREYLKYSTDPLTDTLQLIDIKNQFIEQIPHIKLPYTELQKTPGYVHDRSQFTEKQIHG